MAVKYGGMQDDISSMAEKAKNAHDAVKTTKKAIKGAKEAGKTVASMAAKAAAGDWAGAVAEALKNPKVVIAIIAIALIPVFSLLSFGFIFIVALPGTILFVTNEMGAEISTLYDSIRTWTLGIITGFSEMVRDIFVSPQDKARRAEIISQLEAEEQAVAYDENFGEYVDTSTGLITMINDDFREGYALCLQDAEATANSYTVVDSNVVSGDTTIFDSSTLDKTSGDYADYVWVEDEISVNISQNESISGVKVYLQPVGYLLAIQSVAKEYDMQYDFFSEDDGATATEKDTSLYHLLKTADKFAKDKENGVFEPKVQHRVNVPSSPVVEDVMKEVDDPSSPIYEWVTCTRGEYEANPGDSDYRSINGGYEHYEITGYNQMEVLDYQEAHYVVSVDVSYWVVTKPNTKEIIQAEYGIPDENMDLVDLQYETLMSMYTFLGDAGSLLPGGFACTEAPVSDTEIEAILEALNVSGYRENVIRYALQQVGYFGYLLGSNASNASSGYLDCSGFIQYVYWGAGCSDFDAVSTYNYGSASAVRQISMSELQPGDIAMLYPPGSGGNHVRMYLGDIYGDGTAWWVECCYGHGTVLNNWSGADAGGTYTCAFTYVGGE